MHPQEERALRETITHIQMKMSRLNLAIAAIIRILDKKDTFSKRKLLAVMKKIDRENGRTKGDFRLYDFSNEVHSVKAHNILLMLALHLLDEGGLIDFEHLMKDFEQSANDENGQDLKYKMEQFITFLRKTYD